LKIEGKKITKSFGNPSQEVLHGIDVKIDSGEFVALTGRSGSGKSTLLYILSTLDQPTTGEVFYDGESIANWNSHQIHQLRNEKIGFVFQFHYLLPELTVLENILLPAIKLKKDQELKKRALLHLDIFGLQDKVNRFSGQLSGGEQQRVAIARALIMKPKVLYADEPTGNLDTHNSDLVMKQLKIINQEEKTTIVLITHDPGFALQAQRQIQLVDGSLIKH
jgi:putative ABC transport system ATP-binding protein/lipoprotein-releasing system ATP-binding protein